MSRRPRITLVAGLLLLAPVLFAAPALAQERGTITGTVTDSRGTKLPRVTVVVRNRDTGAERPAVTGPDGTFVVGGLTPGTYDVAVGDPGFVAFKQEVKLEGGATANVMIQLRYTVEDFSPVTDRWRLQFPLWQRYPAEL